MKKIEFLKKIKSMDDKALNAELKNLYIAAQKHRLEISVGKKSNFSECKNFKKSIARIKTEVKKRIG